MTRRAALLAAALLSLTSVAGCPSKDTLAVLIATLGNAVAQIAVLTGHQEIADRLRHDTEIAATALKSWQPGMNGAEAIRAVNRVIDDLKLFPLNDKYRALIALALGTAAAIIDFINAHGGNGDKPHTDVKLTDPPKNTEEFKRTWDAIRAGSVGLEQAPVL